MPLRRDVRERDNRSRHHSLRVLADFHDRISNGDAAKQNVTHGRGIRWRSRGDDDVGGGAVPVLDANGGGGREAEADGRAG